jgi:ABC-2 type transport system ATP-binding protein
MDRASRNDTGHRDYECVTDTKIRIRGLTKRYGSTVAVNGIDLDVTGGEIFALLGPNGAGKTTVIEILEGFRRADSGAVSVLGINPSQGGPRWRAKIGIVLQEENGLATLSVRDVLKHFATYYPNPRDTDELIAAVGLTEKAHSRVSQLSGGQRRRMDVALGLVGRPELVFLDEPTTGFDPEARRQFWEVIEGLRTSGTTILLTTHYLDEAEHLADRVGVIRAGEMVEVNTPDLLGGRQQRPAVVRWQEDGAARETHTQTPTEVVNELSVRFGGEVPGLTVFRPSLEDIYLEMIGHLS